MAPLLQEAVPTNSTPISIGPNLWITGLGSQYPPYLLGPEKLEQLASKFHDIENPGLKKLLQINRTTGIETRSSIRSYDSGFTNQPDPPSISDIDHFFRKAGVDLTVQACKKALREWAGDYSDITHTIGVTCTNQSNPGYDLLVNQKLGLQPTVDRTLLQGVGCAGGLAILRVTAQIACGATMRGRPARILAFACELCTPNVRCDLAEVVKCSDPGAVSIAGALFSDGAAAFILCNDFGLGDDTQPILQLLEWGNATLPDTTEHMGFYVDPLGFRTVLTRNVPELATRAIFPMFQSLVPEVQERLGKRDLKASDFDWALHPGGEAIIESAKELLQLSDDQLRATWEIYRTRGNSSSPTVIIVLDKLRAMGLGRDQIVATSFGPGLGIEMSIFKKCHQETEDW
ncbi:hypothetical protein ONS95_009149 [Cadophora gregata]|uniref:uncharacterized protein n=1 Tax=Cadophora gregata TaxID=51156 RepID=UPI0026DD273F|nr:uncharacterized protein ONS95_009149 [Cadophora gregata]KAK0124167.1 hypothetical protein ONS95_009149 [Cadophora gregata]KAK0130495.1 hypothetical protein ONS96_001014 [Cadophora gregata f. sp. sojae]